MVEKNILFHTDKLQTTSHIVQWGNDLHGQIVEFKVDDETHEGVIIDIVSINVLMTQKPDGTVAPSIIALARVLLPTMSNDMMPIDYNEEGSVVLENIFGEDAE